VVVDTQRARVFVYRNADGALERVADFYASHGKQGAAKAREGDKRTPVGVYRVAGWLGPADLTAFYGAGAFPISYPNALDRGAGRDGFGIWLHGSPRETYARSPRASDGCVVLANDDLNKLAPYLQVGVTPIIITNGMEWSGEQDQEERDALLQAVEQWRKDWASLDTDAYLTHYSRDFSSDSADYAAWVRQKQLVNSGKSWIKVNLSKVSVFTYPEQPNMVVVNFEQDYSSSNLSNRMKKRQYWIKRNNRWQIVYEGAA
jgi:murein L,D-transpeptidase YafK